MNERQLIGAIIDDRCDKMEQSIEWLEANLEKRADMFIALENEIKEMIRKNEVVRNDRMAIKA